MKKVFVDPPRTMSRAMFRVSNALKHHAPDNVEVVRRRDLADIQVMHVIGTDAVPYAAEWDRPYAVLQYCLGNTYDEWQPLWQSAALVWSYYDLQQQIPNKFYHAPLGVDGRVFNVNGDYRSTGLFTSGYVSGDLAEAIEEATIAAERVGLSVVHLGPVPVMGEAKTPMRTPRNWRSLVSVTDSALANEYAQSQWVSGLRHVEGFELPVIEGLACGARPIVFDRLDMRQWYDGHAIFVPETTGETLIKSLVEVLSVPPIPVTADERQCVLTRFSWKSFAVDFWHRLLENVR